MTFKSIHRQLTLFMLLTVGIAGFQIKLTGQTPANFAVPPMTGAAQQNSPTVAAQPTTAPSPVASRPTEAPEPQKWTRPATAIATPPANLLASNAEPSAPNIAPSIADAEFPLFQSNAGEDSRSDSDAKKGIAGPAVTVTSSLAVVLGLFAAMIWLTRRFGSRSMNQGALPKEAFESLGTTSLDARTRVTMLRCGCRVVVVAQTAAGIQPLAEITDPDEVRQLTATCNGNADQSFLDAMRSIEKEPTQPGFVDQTPSQPPRKRSRLFASA